MRVTKAQAQANRAHIVATAAKLFRERGYDGVGVADLMGAAGFTHGGFYKHFPAKADLMAEAAACGFEQSLEKTSTLASPEFVRHYLSREHRDAPGDGCIMAALCADAARQPSEKQREGRCQELHHQQRANEGRLAQPDLRAINGGHGDDRADTVGVHPECDQKEGQVAVMADLLESGA